MQHEELNPGQPLAVVSGAAGGLGFAFVRELCKAKYRVLMIDLDADQMTQRAKSLGDEATVKYLEADIAYPECYVDKITQYTSASVEILVNCAGIAKWATIDDPQNDYWARIIDVNLKGTYALTRSLLPGLKKSQSASIINIVSDSAEVAFAARSAYCASKAGMVSLSNVLRIELKESHVRVMTVFPARINTGFNARIPKPDKRYMDPNNVAELVVQMIVRYPNIEVREIKLCSTDSTYGS